MGSLKTLWPFLLFLGVAAGQTLDNSKLTGKYFFRQLSYGTNTSSTVTDVRSLQGTITFSGTGTFTLSGLQTLNANAPTNVTANGTYSMSPGGIVTLTNPLTSGANINARFASEAVIGSTTELTVNTFDIFVAVPAPTATQNIGSLNGSYFVVTLEFPGANATAVRNTFFNLQSTGAGQFQLINVLGHEADISNGAPSTQFVTGTGYSVNTDGTGILNFNSVANFLIGVKNLYISNSGNVILGASPSQGVQDLLIGIKAIAAGASNASWTGDFWTSGLRYDAVGSASGYVGPMAAIPSLSKVSFTRREHQINFSPAFDFTGVNNFTINSDGTGTAELENIALGAGGNLFVAAEVNQSDPGGYAIDFGVTMPALSGTGVFLNPNAVANAASGAFGGAAICPGEFIALSGTGLSDQTMISPAPYPPILAGVSVAINNLPAPMFFVSSKQLNVLVPYAITGAKATIVVTNNGKVSNSVDVPIAKTSPGIFSVNQSGTGPGAITHLDGTLVNAASPAHHGDIVVVYLTGLGAVTPAVPDGTAATSVTNANLTPAVRIANEIATVGFAGLSSYPGLYQINVTVPPGVFSGNALPLAIMTTDAFHDQVDIAIQ
jgi:uncharacterized protein (TIGR03437 family)